MTSYLPHHYDPEGYFIQSREDAQLALLVLTKSEIPKYLIQPSADSIYFPYLVQYIENVANRGNLPDGKLIFSLHDAIWSKDDTFPILTFGRPVGDKSCFLLPDPFYIQASGYMEGHAFLKGLDVAWAKRKPLAYFRGSSTGGQLMLNSWRTNRRVKLVELSLKYPNLIDARITAIVQEEEAGVSDEIAKAGLISAFEPPETSLNYKYLVDIDGNANSWGYFLKLAMGSLVFKVDSMWEQWFYEWIEPWVHYVPVKADLSDLVEKIEWALSNDSQAEQIAKNGKEFALKLNYDLSVDYGIDLLTEAINAMAG